MSGSVLALSILGLLNVWVVLGLASILGIFRPFDRVVGLSVLPDIVNREQIQNGVALSTIGRDITQIAGAVLGGFLLAVVGTSWSYVMIVPLYFLSALFIIGIKNISRTTLRERESVTGNLLAGLRYVRSVPVIYGLLIVAFIVNLSAFPLFFGLLAVLARDVLETTSKGLGQLLGVHAAGAMVGALLIASFSSTRVPGRTVMAASALWHVGIIAVAYMKSFTVSLPFLFFTGLAQAFSMILMTMMILTITPVEMRGRVLGLRQLAVYGLPLGLLFSGFVAQRYGVSVALVVNGVVGLGALVLATMRWSEMVRPPAQ